jgi:hypothetical protein
MHPIATEIVEQIVGQLRAQPEGYQKPLGRNVKMLAGWLSFKKVNLKLPSKTVFISQFNLI